MSGAGERQQGALTVRELVSESGLGLKTVTGDVGIDRAIKGVHFTELTDPILWMGDASLLINTGQAFATDVSEGLLLLDRLATIDTAAMAVATGHNIESIPEAMIERALKLRIPLLEIPFGVRIRTVIAYIYNALASTDMHHLRRTVAMQNQLVELMAADSGAEELIAKVAAIIDLPLVLFDGSGKVIASAGLEADSTLPQRLWQSWSALAESSRPLGVAEASHGQFYFREVVLFGKVERLITSSSPPGASSEFVFTALSFLQRLITLDLLKRRDELEARRRTQQTLLRDFLAAAADPEELTEWIGEQGVNLRRPWRVAICEAERPSPGKLRRGSEVEDLLVEVVDVFLGGRRARFLSRPRRHNIAILFSEGSLDTPVRDLLAQLRSVAAEEPYALNLAVGCSSTHSAAGEGERAYWEAREACAAAGRGTGAGGLVLFEDLSGRFRLLQGQTEEALLDIARRTIAPLIEHDARRNTRLLKTLQTLFDHGLALQPTAQALFIHRNSLNKRLRRIESLLDVDLTDLDDVMEIYLGLRATELLGQTVVAESQGAAPPRPKSRDRSRA